MPTNTLSTSAEEILPRNLLRKSFIVQNTDSSIAVFIRQEQNTTAVSSSIFDVKLGPGDSFSLNSLTDGKEQITQRYTAVAASGSPVISLFETEDIDR